jgi:hypothetical protein
LKKSHYSLQSNKNIEIINWTQSTGILFKYFIGIFRFCGVGQVYTARDSCRIHSSSEQNRSYLVDFGLQRMYIDTAAAGSCRGRPAAKVNHTEKTMSAPFQQAEHKLRSILAANGGDADCFAETIRRDRVPHLSFSQVTTLEFCPYRYYLQYVLFKELDPIPDYFVKGKRMHALIAQTYAAMRANHAPALNAVDEAALEEGDGLDARHIRNAYQVHRAHVWADHEIRAIEHPFVFSIDPNLPPLVGVIDLMLVKDECYYLVDHKTGRDFYPDDALQVAMYARYIHTQHHTENVRLFYDHYRWVNNLDRIRKPAFERREVVADPGQWELYLDRIQRAYRAMESIARGARPERCGACFRCPYRGQCA